MVPIRDMMMLNHVCLLVMAVGFAKATPTQLAAANVDWPHAHCEVQYTVSGAEVTGLDFPLSISSPYIIPRRAILYDVSTQ